MAANGEQSLYGDEVYREIVRHCAAALCHTAGFTSADPEALTLMTQVMLSYMNKLCRRARESCEHSGRTQVNLLDAQQALVISGMKLSKIGRYLQIPAPSVLVEIGQQPSPPVPPATLKVGDANRVVHTPHIPNYLPPLPDPHTYMKTEISGEAESSYERVRELSAINKRNTENALENYVISIAPSVSVFRKFEEELMNEAVQVIDAQNAQNEDPFSLKETKKSYIKKRLPTWCQILLPFDEPRPAYLSALLNDEEIGMSESDKSNYFANMLSNELERDPCDDTNMVDTTTGGVDETFISFMNARKK